MYNVIVVHGGFPDREAASKYAGEVMEAHRESDRRKVIGVRVQDSARSIRRKAIEAQVGRPMTWA